MKRRTAWLLVGGVATASILAAAAGGLVLALKLGAGTALGGKKHLQIALSGTIPDQPEAELGLLFGGGNTPSLRGIVEGLEAAGGDPNVDAVVLRVGSLDGTGWGRIQEIRDALGRFRRSKKPAYAYLEDGGNKEYYLASACSRVVAAPASLLMISGLSIQTTFYRGTLDKLGVAAEFEGFGKYKNAPNRYTETAFTPAHREQMEALLDDLYGQFVEGIANGRGRTVAEVQRLVDEGPYDAALALKAGLVDELLYRDELEKKLEASKRIGLTPYVRSRRDLGLGADKIALVHVTGEIVSGDGGSDPFGGEYAGSETITRALREASERSDVKAIVVRIDSPGGSGSASDAIWREVVEAKRHKPVIASMGDAAASGGYYVAMGAHSIVADPATLTGSIGVFGGKFSLRGLYDKLGMTKEELQRGRHAGMFSDYRPWSAEERLRIREILGAFYGEFVRKAAEGRGRKGEEIEAVAQGRVWTGASALSHGLVDQLGGLSAALDLARAKAGIGKDQTVVLLSLPERKGLLELLLERNQPSVLVAALPGDVRSLLRMASAARGGGVFARLPFEVEVE